MSDSEATALSRTFVVKNRQGMHLRPASQLVQIFAEFPEAEVRVRVGETGINGKSIMGLLMLEASQGSELTVEVIGPGGEEILARVEETIENRFGED